MDPFKLNPTAKYNTARMKLIDHMAIRRRFGGCAASAGATLANVILELCKPARDAPYTAGAAMRDIRALAGPLAGHRPFEDDGCRTPEA